MSDPDDKMLFDALREAGVSQDLAYTAVQEVRNMAGQKVIAAIDVLRVELNDKIDAQGSKIDGKIDAQKEILGTKIDAQKGMVWTLIGILTTAVLGGIVGLAALLYQMFLNSQ